MDKNNPKNTLISKKTWLARADINNRCWGAPWTGILCQYVFFSLIISLFIDIHLFFAGAPNILCQVCHMFCVCFSADFFCFVTCLLDLCRCPQYPLLRPSQSLEVKQDPAYGFQSGMFWLQHLLQSLAYFYIWWRHCPCILRFYSGDCIEWDEWRSCGKYQLWTNADSLKRKIW